jgi:hypothetical protein
MNLAHVPNVRRRLIGLPCGLHHIMLVLLSTACGEQPIGPASEPTPSVLPPFQAVVAPRLSPGYGINPSIGPSPWDYLDSARANGSSPTGQQSVLHGDLSGAFIKESRTQGKVESDAGPGWNTFFVARTSTMGTHVRMTTKMTVMPYPAAGVIPMENQPRTFVAAPKQFACWLASSVLCDIWTAQVDGVLGPIPNFCGANIRLHTFHESWVWFPRDLPFPPQYADSYDTPEPPLHDCIRPPESTAGSGGGGTNDDITYTYTICQYEAVFDDRGEYLYTNSLGCSSTTFTVPRETRIYEI